MGDRTRKEVEAENLVLRDKLESVRNDLSSFLDGEDAEDEDDDESVLDEAPTDEDEDEADPEN